MLFEGQAVRIAVRDRRNPRNVKGAISEILTNATSHPHGILVRLDSGEEGRVQALIDQTVDVAERVPKKLEELEKEAKSIEEKLNSSENHYLEFKESLLWSQDLDAEELNRRSKETKRYGRDASKIIAAKVVAAFLNSDGGQLIIGVKETKTDEANEIIGIEVDFGKLKDKCVDGYRRYILDSLIQPYFPKFVFQRFADYIDLSFLEVQGKTICVINVAASDSRVFLNFKNESAFVIRVDASNRVLENEEILAYCDLRF
jgi:uncharacterized repeat protein (TIGR03833 family)